MILQIAVLATTVLGLWLYALVAYRAAQTACQAIQKPIPPIRRRDDIAGVLQADGLRTGVELGVHSGDFAKHNLKHWPSCTSYLLVDAWQHLENYIDGANSGHNEHFEKTIENVEPYKNKVHYCRNLTSVCARLHRGIKFDFVYVDARHDYKGVLQDLIDWWPMVSPGGIMAGHDFVEQHEGPAQTHQNWTVNYDGTVDGTGRVARGAVVDFFGNLHFPSRYRQIYVTYQNNGWWTWIVRK